ncbi:Uncharacterized protein APZ42_007464 [Daphnia magna]|uniref:Uncharacterized protein n=1 Tax=Daphnia magna TaxID=35525 RepID=A0A164F9N4_9CRUS|nr:Uncharacterized protein APZ42_007464 [Daphnia magna]
MEKQLTLSLHHLYHEITTNQEKIFQIQTSRLPSLILAIRSLKEREANFQSNNPKIRTQLIWLLKDIQLTYLNPNNPQITEWKKPTSLLKYLTAILEVKLSIRAKKTKKTEQQASELTAIFTTHARQFLTFLFGQIYNITDLTKLTQTKNKIVCTIFPNLRITGSDVRQPTSHLILELKEFSLHLEHLLLTHQQTFLAEIHNLVLYLKNLQLLTLLEPLIPEIKSLLTKLDTFPAVIRPNNVQLTEKIKQTLIQTKTNLRQLLPLNTTSQPNQALQHSRPRRRPRPSPNRD